MKRSSNEKRKNWMDQKARRRDRDRDRGRGSEGEEIRETMQEEYQVKGMCSNVRIPQEYAGILKKRELRGVKKERQDPGLYMKVSAYVKNADIERMIYDERQTAT